MVLILRSSLRIEILYATRGTIYDKNDEILAETVDSYTVIAYLDSSRSKNSTTPKHVIDKRETANKFPAHGGIPET